MNAHSTKKALLLAGVMATLALAGCGGGGGGGGSSGGDSSRGGADNGDSGPSVQLPTPDSSETTGEGGGGTPKVVMVGFQPVPGTPVSKVVPHAGHGPLALSPDALKGTLKKSQPKPLREWVVSAQMGNDSAAGNAGAPFRTITQAISVAGPGDLIKVQAGTYAEAVEIGEAAKAGTAAAPITLQGEGAPKIVPAGDSVMVAIARPYWIVDGFDIDGQWQRVFPVGFSGNVEGSVIANSEIHDASHGAGVNVHTNARGATIENNHIHSLSQGETDTHGVVVQTTTRDTTVRNNDIHGTSGDSVQCLGPEGYSNNPPAEGLVVENNHFYSNRENAVDIKTCKNVVIRNNRMHDFRPSSSSKGDAVVIHMSASNVLVEGNDIYDSGKGIAVGGNREGPLPSKVILRHNRIHDLTRGEGGEGTGIRLENSEGTQVFNNTVTRVPGFALVLGYGTGGPTQNLKVRNNIFDAPQAVDIGGERPGLQMDRNLYAPGGVLQIDGHAESLANWQAQGFDKSSLQASPGFAGAGAEDETLAPNGSAVDKGVDVGLPFCGGAPDIGAVETGC